MGPRDWIAHCKRDVCLLTEAVHKDDVKPGYRCRQCCRRGCTVFFPKANAPSKIMALIGKPAPGTEPEPEEKEERLLGGVMRDPVSGDMVPAPEKSPDETQILPPVEYEDDLDLDDMAELRRMEATDDLEDESESE